MTIFAEVNVATGTTSFTSRISMGQLMMSYPPDIPGVLRTGLGSINSGFVNDPAPLRYANTVMANLNIWLMLIYRASAARLTYLALRVLNTRFHISTSFDDEI